MIRPAPLTLVCVAILAGCTGFIHEPDSQSNCLRGEVHAALESDAEACDPEPEQCNGADDDCDGAIDEDGDAPCASGLPGRCAEGVPTCVGDDRLCRPVHAPLDELCNGQDDDCDGTIDESLRDACGGCDLAIDEVCDGRDDDCDGLTDEQAACPGDQACIEGACAAPCPSGECPAALDVCVDGWCVEPCALVECPDDRRCEDGVCVDDCAPMRCDAGTVCFRGACVEDSCYAVPCPRGEVCVDDACTPDPCADVDCGPDAFCRRGACVDSCRDVACPLDAQCVDGVCAPDPCFDIDCPADQACRDGACVADACVEVHCPVGRGCVDGDCVPDPCFDVDCPPGADCVVREGLAQCDAEDVEMPPPPPADGGVELDGGVGADGGFELADASGEPPPSRDFGALPGAEPDDLCPPEMQQGLHCDAGDAPGQGWMLLLAVLGLMRRRTAT